MHRFVVTPMRSAFLTKHAKNRTRVDRHSASGESLESFTLPNPRLMSETVNFPRGINSRDPASLNTIPNNTIRKAQSVGTDHNVALR